MDVQFSVGWLVFGAPWVAALFVSWMFSPVKKGGTYFPATSDRDMYWFAAIPGTLIVSLASLCCYLAWWK